MKNKTLILASLYLGILGSSIAPIMADVAGEADAFDNTFNQPKKTFLDRFTLGSYGELHGRTGDGVDNIDLHRMVILLDFEITDRIKLVTETEFEHAYFWDKDGNDKDLEFEIEQAYIEFTLRDDLLLNFGIQLMPVGLVNVTHEPTTFFGVERPNVEKYIVPSTWWEAALSLVKTYENGLQVDVMLHTALDMNKDGYIRSGRPKLDFSDYTDSESWGITGRAKYTGITGLEIATSVQFQQDVSTQVSGDQNTFLTEAHVIYRNGGFEFRALGAYWNVNGFADSNTKNQWGYYLEPSYTFDVPCGKLGVFARFSQFQYYNSTRRENKEYTVGMNFWPRDEVVFKVDYTHIDSNGTNNETVNFGIGYHF